MGFVQGDPQAIMIVEYSGETEAEVRAKVEALEALRARKRIGYAAHIAYDPAEQQSIWKLRKAGLGLLLGTKGDRKPIAFVEDTAVDPAKLGPFIARFREILGRHGAAAGYYGHCSVGCLHIRPLINLKDAGEIRKMRAIAEEITALVMEFGGGLSGEHGDGRARSPFNETLYGPKLYDAFRQVKRAFDPKGILNPGNIVDAPPMTEHLRYGPEYRAWEPETLLDFSGQGGFAGAVEMCNGIGVCRKKLEGTMCPSYMATLDEEHSTRGRANALRAVLSGKVPRSEFTGRRLYEVLDLCLECKACKAECPANVDMAKIKYEFLAHYYRAKGLPLRNRIFGRIHRLARIGSALAPLSNWIARSAPHRWLLERVAGIDRRRPLPAFAAQSFDRWFGRRRPEGNGARGEVVLFHDTFNTYQTPGVAMAATRLLETLGYRVSLADRGCCGRPMISKGMLDEARTLAAANIARLAGAARQGRPIIGLEPSCLLTLRDEYPELVRTEDARLVAKQSVLLEEFLQREWARGEKPKFAAHGRPALLHGHCHQKALVGTGPTVAVLKAAGYTVTEVDAGCCGMAGSFGFEAEHYDLSIKIAERRLAPAVRAAGADVAVCAPGHLVPPAGGAHDGARAEAPGGASLGGSRPLDARGAGARPAGRAPLPDLAGQGEAGGVRVGQPIRRRRAGRLEQRRASAGGAGRHATPSAPSARARPGGRSRSRRPLGSPRDPRATPRARAGPPDRSPPAPAHRPGPRARVSRSHASGKRRSTTASRMDSPTRMRWKVRSRNDRSRPGWRRVRCSGATSAASRQAASRTRSSRRASSGTDMGGPSGRTTPKSAATPRGFHPWTAPWAVTTAGTAGMPSRVSSARASGCASTSMASNARPHDESNSLVLAQELQPGRW